MRRLIAILMIIAPQVSATDRGAERVTPLSNLEGRKLVISTPYGDMSVLFLSQGRIVGSAPFAQSLFDSSPSVDRGRWWVSAPLLYVQWAHWLDGKAQAYRLEFVTGGPIRWSGPDGMEGVARFDDGASLR